MHVYDHPLLTDDDLRRLTGYEQPRRQMAWLERNGIGFFVARGLPKTTWGAVDHALIGEATSAEEPDLSSIEPNGEINLDR